VKNESNQRKVPTRRDVLRILAVGGAGVVVWRLGRLGSRERAAVTRSRLLMGTEVRLTVLGDDREAAEAAADATLERMSALESLLTRYREDSEVSRLNGTGQIDDASDALLDVLRLAHHVSRLGDGAFDITVQPVLDLYRARRAGGDGLPGPEEIERAVALVDHGGLIVEGRTVTLDRPGMRVTLDGIGKGYVVDAGVAVLRERGFPDVFVDAGGDLVAAGDKGGGEPWRIGIRNPRPGAALQARFDARNSAVATSGDYMQPFTPDLIQHHILDPRTGYSAPELASATVIAGDAATADALATLSMVLGPQRGRELLEDLPDCEGYLVAKDLEVTRTTGFAVL
jgi:thiamine biosynthesis lipoprotein